MSGHRITVHIALFFLAGAMGYGQENQVPVLRDTVSARTQIYRVPETEMMRIQNINRDSILRVRRDSMEALRSRQADTASAVTEQSPQGAQIEALQQIAVRRVMPGFRDVQTGSRPENIRRYRGWAQLNEQYSAPRAGLPALVPVFRAFPLKYDAERQLFSGTLRFGLFDPTRSQAMPLPEPMKFLFFPGGAGSVVPEEIVFDSSNGMVKDLELIEEHPAGRTSLLVVTYAQPEGVEIPVDVEAALLFATRSRSLQGWGLESIPVSILLRGADDEHVAVVTFEADRGAFTPQTLELRGGRIETARLRSQGLGAVSIRIASPRFQDQMLEMHYAFPWMFFLLACSGGLLGSVVSWLLRKRGKEDIRAASYIPGWTLFGLIAAIVYLVLGVNIIGIDLGDTANLNEMLVFGIAALAPLSSGLLKRKTSSE
jgi:hypothetical protein